ncbi:MAG TPA: hypothetical protein VGI79_00870 [Caulobacteraceae bacterium]
MSSEPPPFERHDPNRYTATLAYRPRDQLPRDLTALATDAVLMLDTTVYIDAQKAKLPIDLAARLAGAEILHCAIALGEIAAGLGLLDPKHPGTPAIRKVLLETLAKADPARSVAPSADAWLEASTMAGTLARTQGLPKHDRRKLLNDALLFLTAGETQAVLVSRNSNEMDLLLRLRPDVQVLLYDLKP